MMILPLIFIVFLFIEPAFSISHNSVFGYSIKGDDEFAKYPNNLHYLLGSLSSHSSITRFSNFTTTLNRTPNKLHGIYFCQGDLDPQTCHSCIDSARKYILRYYPDGMEGLIWYKYCMIRYSNESFLGKFDNTMWTSFSDNKKVAGNRFQFMNILRRTLKGLATQAAYVHNSNKFASKIVKIGVVEDLNLYAMVQCTPDLVATDCYRCLSHASQKILATSYGSTSARVIYKNCFVHYKTTLAFSDDEVKSSPNIPTPATKNTTLIQLRVQVTPIPFSNSDRNWPINNPSRICFQVRFGNPPFSNNTINSSSTPLSWAITNSSSSSPSWKVELKELNLDDADSSERSKEWVAA